ncbi:MAG: biotin/lipoyl-binding protein [Bacteroidetes bacterium]|nr:MAG: biotin/lipoyl-binding protein [Bacteroidota bacterium]
MEYSKPITTITTLTAISLLWVLLATSCNSSTDKAPQQTATKTSIEQPTKIEPEKVVGLARIEPEGKTINIRPQLSGTLEKVNTKLGAKVQKGQILFVLEHQLEEVKLDKIAAQIKEQQSNIKMAEINLKKAQIDADLAQKNYNRIKKVYEQGAGTKASLDDAEAALKSALTEVDTRKQAVENARIRLEQLRADQHLAKIELDKHFIKAPAAGLILDVPLAVGASVNSSTVLAEFAAESPTDAVAEIDELFADRLQLNLPAYVRRQGRLDTLASGYVVELAPALSQKSLFSDELGQLEDRRVRKVRVRLTEGEENLLYGQRVECVISLKNKAQ